MAPQSCAATTIKAEAWRLVKQRLADEHGCRICSAGEIAALQRWFGKRFAKTTEAIPMGHVQVKGRETPIQIYQVA